MSKAQSPMSDTESIFQLEADTDHASVPTLTGASLKPLNEANQWESPLPYASTSPQDAPSSLIDPYADKPQRWVGKVARFDHEGKRLTGTVVAYHFVGLTKNGKIPDYSVTIRGQSGKELTVSMHETYMDIE